MSQVASSVRLEMGEIMVNRAFTGVLRKYLTSLQSAQKGKPAEHTDDADIALGSIDLIVTTQDVQQSPSIESLSTKCADVSSKYLHDAKSSSYLPYFADEMRSRIKADIAVLARPDGMPIAKARKMLDEASSTAYGYLESHWLERFLGSDHYGYILEVRRESL